MSLYLVSYPICLDGEGKIQVDENKFGHKEEIHLGSSCG